MLCAHQIWFLHVRCMHRVPTHWPLWSPYPDLKYFQAAQKAIISGYACVCSVWGHLQRPKLRFEQTPNKSSGITLAHAMLTTPGLRSAPTWKPPFSIPASQRQGKPSPGLWARPSQTLPLLPSLSILLFPSLCNYTAPAQVHWSLASEIIKIRALSPDLGLLLLQSRHGASEMCYHHVECQPIARSASLCLQTFVLASATQRADGPSLFVFSSSQKVKIYSSDFNGLSNCMWWRVNGG